MVWMPTVKEHNNSRLQREQLHTETTEQWTMHQSLPIFEILIVPYTWSKLCDLHLK